MGQRNDGQGEINALQNRFTAYILIALIALRRKKRDYLQKKARVETYEYACAFQASQFVRDSGHDGLLPVTEIEDSALMLALARLTAKERYILFGRVLNDCGYDELAHSLNLRYNGVATAYHRIIKKLKKMLQEGSK